MEHKLFEQTKKCETFKSELKYLGHVVYGSRVKLDPAKVETISQWPTPSSVHEMRQFLGLANYFRKFIRGYAATASPLTDLSMCLRACLNRSVRVATATSGEILQLLSTLRLRLHRGGLKHVQGPSRRSNLTCRPPRCWSSRINRITSPW